MKYLFSSLFTIIALVVGNGQVITVGLGGDFPTLSAAESSISAGDTVLILDGIYSSGSQFLEDLTGTPSQPILIMAAHEHAAIFRGGTEAIHLINCSYLELRDLIIEQQTGNGINIDDGGDYATPAHHISIFNCIFRDMAGTGNNDLLKLSGLDDFLIKGCSFVNGSAGGSGIDMVGCHHGVIEDNFIDRAGSSGIQAKGGTQHILIRRNILKDLDQRALNLGGSTGLQFFRPPLPNPIVDAFEAADLQVYSNIFIGSWSPAAYVGSVRVQVVNNTIFKPENWVIRILQETTESGFLPCGNNEFRNNIIYLESDLTEVNIGPDTDPNSFVFTNNLWYVESGQSWSPMLPVTDSNQVLANPLFADTSFGNFSVPPESPAVMAGKSLSEPSLDYDQRSYYDPPSIGAFEGHEDVTNVPYLIQDASIIMGPNPSSDTVTIDGDFSEATIHVLDSNGILVQDYSNTDAPLIIDLNGLPNGLYFIYLQSQQHAKLGVWRILKVSE
ncbi:MAG: right-handed parallel beta-helix repeat-containing protein [Saprospiraceae bacterium]|nr:right-handed parallel beta-helix repeat-containing protein [Saprospiraceae bacterium]